MAMNESEEDEWEWTDLNEFFVVDFVGWYTSIVQCIRWWMTVEWD